MRSDDCAPVTQGEAYKARLGFSSGSVISCRSSWAGGMRRVGGNSLCGDAPGLGARGCLTRRARQGSFRDAVGPPLPACLVLGDPLCCPLCPWAVLASLLSHELGSRGPGGRNRAPWPRLPEKRARKGGYGDRPQGGGSLLASMGREDAYLFPSGFLILLQVNSDTWQHLSSGS